VKSLFFSLSMCCSLIAFAPSRAAEPFALRDGDRVVFVGSTLIEREQRYGYWETALTRRYPDKSIIFRNLGWSGDTVFGDARAGFGTQADGFRQLKDHVLALKPTVIFIGYGTNESFEGKKGLPRFVKGLETLLDAFAPTKARIVLLSPLRQEYLGRPLPDPAENNKNLRLYADAIRDAAKKRGHVFVDLYDLLGKEENHLTDNGIHLTEYGYWRSAVVLELALGLPNDGWSIEINTQGKVIRSDGARIDKIATEPLRFRNTADWLPPSLPLSLVYGRPLELPSYALSVKGLVAGRYTLSIDDQEVLTADAEEWANRISISYQFDPQTERLRQTIIAKNRLYFYRWRPENETYLFGFRKHEQGQNAREIPQFDPLVADKEKEIAKLRVPAPHTYELKTDKKN
jgi:lysophospholipase L1-like esterase